ncbi:MAG TPA: hypothetical protein VE258_03195 [Ktedonobacterales bacterium]|nr:hypothetical protein [Ktedonobacterales bacterium]
MKVADARVPHARLFVIAAAVAACAAILWLSRTFNFYFDEWTFILPTDTGWTTYLQPHNEHPAMALRLIYAVLLATVGMRSYLPYMAVLLGLHATSVVLLFELVRRRAGDVIAIAAALILLVLGAGWENLLWAFQIGFVGSVALGLGALLVIGAVTPRMWLAALLLFGSLLFSGIGLFFLIVAAVWLVLTPSRRRELVWLAPVAIALVAWYVAYGRSGATGSLTGNLEALPLYVVWGLAASVAGLIGQSVYGPAILVFAVVAIAFTWRRRRPDGFAIGVAVALIAFYVVIGLSRAQIGYQQSGAGRYVYEGAIFWLLLLADAARGLPWRGTWRPALIALVFLACFSSSVLLYSWALAKTAQMLREAADLQALAEERRDPCLNPKGAVDPLVLPQISSPVVYYGAVDRYGDPEAGVSAIRGADFDRAGTNLVKPGCVRPAESP